MLSGCGRRVALALTASVVAVATACGSDDGSDSATDDGTDVTSDGGSVGGGAAELVVPDEVVDLGGQAVVEVEVRDNTFDPVAIHVDPGTEVVWVNVGFNSHNVTPSEEGTFEPIVTADLERGEDASISFPDAGEFFYYCTIHGTPTLGQNGVILVGRAE